MSWAHQAGGYHLLCNRDELRTRGPARGPETRRTGGTRWIAPVDSDFGGTWIAVNEWGLAMCLLNGNGGHRRSRSRGLLIPELLCARSMEDAALALEKRGVAAFAPFRMVMLQPEQPAAVAAWDGVNLSLDRCADALSPLVSSSFEAAEVRRIRRAEFARRVQADHADPSRLYWFHASHGEEPNAYSPCMHRPDAETVSFSWIVVTPREIRFLYAPAAPCRCIPSDQEILVRAA